MMSARPLFASGFELGLSRPFAWRLYYGALEYTDHDQDARSLMRSKLRLTCFLAVAVTNYEQLRILRQEPRRVGNVCGRRKWRYYGVHNEKKQIPRTYSGLQLVASEHPDLNAGTEKPLDGLRHLLSKTVLDCCTCI